VQPTAHAVFEPESGHASDHESEHAPPRPLPALPAPGMTEGDDFEGSLVEDVPPIDAPPAEPMPLRASFDAEQDQEFDDLTEMLTCNIRRRLLLHLCLAGPTAVTALAVAIGESQPVTSSHLSQLRRAHLVFNKRKGRERPYEANPKLARIEQREGRLYLEVGRADGTTVRLGVNGRAAVDPPPSS
jgi:DNA-binding transcriptional ArsR family regulator